MTLSRHALERIIELPLSDDGKAELGRRLHTVASRLTADREYYVSLGSLPSMVGEAWIGRNGSQVFAVIAHGSVITLFPRRATQNTRSRDVGKRRVNVNILAGLK